MGLAHASSADVPLSELIKAYSLKATATGLTVGIVGLSQSSGEAHLDDHLSLCCLDVGCKERRKMSLVINECAIFKRDEHGLSRRDRYDHAGPVCGSAASSAVPRDHHLHMWRRSRCQGLRWLQAATGLGMRLQEPARPDLRARGMGLEGCSLYHAQPTPCQPAFTSPRLGRTAILCKFANKTAEGLISNLYCTPKLRSMKPNV